jgi:membrane associated rhomboid family serine protease
MMQNDHLRPDQIPPINPLPGVVWLLAVPMILLELAFSLGDSGAIGGRLAIGWRIAGLEGYGIFPDYWRQQWQIGALDFELLRRFITYPFLHGSASQALFGVAMTLALGKF